MLCFNKNYEENVEPLSYVYSIRIEQLSLIINAQLVHDFLLHLRYNHRGLQ